MNPDAPADAVLAVSVIFARVGGLFLIAPGLSSTMIPVQVRLFLAMALTLALAPLLFEPALAAVVDREPSSLVFVLATETGIGLTIGLLSRLLLMALSFMAMAIANFTGLGVVPGLAVDGDETGQAVTNLFNITAVTIIFLSDLHYEILRAALGSYDVIAAGGGLDPQAALDAIATRFGEAFAVGLRLAAPFIIYAIIVNFAVGLTNKLTPQLPVFFVSLPLVTAGGLIIMAMVIREVMLAFLDAFAQLTAAI